MGAFHFFTFFCYEPVTNFKMLFKTLEKFKNTYPGTSCRWGSPAKNHRIKHLLNFFGVPGFGPSFALGGPGGEVAASLSFPNCEKKRGRGLGALAILISV